MSCSAFLITRWRIVYCFGVGPEAGTQTVRFAVRSVGGVAFGQAQAQGFEEFHSALDTSHGTVVLLVNHCANDTVRVRSTHALDGAGYLSFVSLVTIVRSSRFGGGFGTALSLDGAYMALRGRRVQKPG